jgi:hypothetical protein
MVMKRFPPDSQGVNPLIKTRRCATMAQEENQPSADTGTKDNATASPTWDSFNGELHPFLQLNEEIKRAGFRVKFLSDAPRKETVNNFDNTQTDFWFDVEHEEETRTWTMSQKSLVMELQKHKPLNGKSFDIKLIPVDDKFKEKFPKYKGKDRYSVTPADTAGSNRAPKVEEETFK